MSKHKLNGGAIEVILNIACRYMRSTLTSFVYKVMLETIETTSKNNIFFLSLARTHGLQAAHGSHFAHTFTFYLR